MIKRALPSTGLVNMICGVFGYCMCNMVFVMVVLGDKDGLNVALDGGYSVS